MLSSSTAHMLSEAENNLWRQTYRMKFQFSLFGLIRADVNSTIKVSSKPYGSFNIILGKMKLRKFLR